MVFSCMRKTVLRIIKFLSILTAITKSGSYASEASAAVAHNKAADLAKTFGVTKQFPENYVDTLNPREYAELYTHVKISKKYIDYLKKHSLNRNA